MLARSVCINNTIFAYYLFDFYCRSPFRGDKDYMDIQSQLLELAFEMATSAHRGIFSQTPNRIIRGICETLAKIADHIIQVFIIFLLVCV